MEYVYAALLLHKAGKEITEDAVKKVLTAAGTKVDDAKVKSLIASLKEVNIDEAISKGVAFAAAPAPAKEAAETKGEEKVEEEEKVSEEEAASGLSALFG
jgi:large subunit ribosomal protein L12